MRRRAFTDYRKRRPMLIYRTFQTLCLIALMLFTASFSSAQGKLAAAKSIKCTFPLISTSTWTNGKPQVEVKPSTLVLEFEAVNTDEGSAQLKGGFGTYDIVV